MHETSQNGHPVFKRNKCKRVKDCELICAIENLLNFEHGEQTEQNRPLGAGHYEKSVRHQVLHKQQWTPGSTPDPQTS
jgi:hypothetical protein